MPFYNEFIDQSIFRFCENIPRIKTCLNELNEDQIWQRPNNNSNSIGNLILHLCGNIKQYIISALGESKDTRTRDVEFSIKDGYNKQDLIELLCIIEKASVIIIKELPHENLLKPYNVQGFNLTGLGVILHVIEHFSFHTGQITFYTKLLKDKDLGYYADLEL